MDEKELKWAINQLKNNDNDDFLTQAKLQAAREYVVTLAERTSQLKGELDGRLWDHTNW